ncbi:hypothetical protein BH09PAT4_BH09PAT4_04620 [soil metagenome]
MFDEYLKTFFWGLTGAVTMAVALPLLLVVFDKFTPIDEWAEIKKGNMAVGVIIAALIIGFAIVMGFCVVPSV